MNIVLLPHTRTLQKFDKTLPDDKTPGLWLFSFIFWNILGIGMSRLLFNWSTNECWMEGKKRERLEILCALQIFALILFSEKKRKKANIKLFAWRNLTMNWMTTIHIHSTHNCSFYIPIFFLVWLYMSVYLKRPLQIKVGTLYFHYTIVKRVYYYSRWQFQETLFLNFISLCILSISLTITMNKEKIKSFQ